MKWPQVGSRASRLAAGVDGAPMAGSLDSDTASLVSLAARLREVEPPVISAAYSADLRLALLQAAPDLIGSGDAVIGDVAPRPQRIRARTVRLSAATAVVVLTTGTGVGYASTSALPGEPLYPVKRTIEKVQLVVAGSPFEKGYEHLTQASTRLSEVADLSVDDSSAYTQTLMAQTLDDFATSAEAGAQLLLDAYAADQGRQPMETLRDFNEEWVDELEGLGSEVDDDVQDEVVVAALTVRAIDEVAVDTCDCDEPAVDVSQTLLTMAPEVEDIPAPDVTVPATATVGAPTTADLASTVPGSPSTDVTTPATPGGSVAAPPAVPPLSEEFPPPVSDTPPAPTTEAPPATTEAPPATSEAPPATSEAPPATSDPPPATSEAPPATSDPPSASDEPPFTPHPSSVNEPPGTTSPLESTAPPTTDATQTATPQSTEPAPSSAGTAPTQSHSPTGAQMPTISSWWSTTSP